MNHRTIVKRVGSKNPMNIPTIFIFISNVGLGRDGSQRSAQ